MQEFYHKGGVLHHPQSNACVSSFCIANSLMNYTLKKNS